MLVGTEKRTANHWESSVVALEADIVLEKCTRLVESAVSVRVSFVPGKFLLVSPLLIVSTFFTGCINRFSKFPW